MIIDLNKGDVVKLPNNITARLFNIFTITPREVSYILKDVASGKFYLRIFQKTDEGVNLEDCIINVVPSKKTPAYFAIYPYKR
ncbi:MAG TPA: hypothetical protein DCS08_04815 [Candidatus Moranbacteria bacterium]|nr:hypothetical protein [Candidatus Moranbacteria bacterium]HBY10933.1 hypothetical protein [Candidatus Moranbacteria bacterium]